MPGKFWSMHEKTGVVPQTLRQGRIAALFAALAVAVLVHMAAVAPAAAQSGDQRVLALEEQVRSLSGQVEELNFLLLQMQEQLRKMQEDNDFRFRQIEEGSVQGSGDEMLAEAPPQRPVEPDAGAANGGSAAVAPDSGQAGVPPRNLGTIRINPDGSVGDVTLGEPMDLRNAAPPASPDETTVAALPQAGSAEELYSNAYEFVLAGDYRMAEEAFRRHVEQYPQDARTADARYWLGESLLAQQRYTEAAEIFLAARRDHPDARKAPDMLMKLGVTLTAMGNRDLACAAFKEVGVRYPDASAVLRDRVRQEQALAGC